MNCERNKIYARVNKVNGDNNGIYNTDVVQLMLASIDKLATSHDNTNKKVDKLIEAMGQQGIILERLASMDKRHADSMNRIHIKADDIALRAKEDNNLLERRIEVLEVKCATNTEDILEKASVANVLKDIQKKMEKLKFFILIGEYPKWAFSGFVLIIFLLVKESRDTILQLLGML